MEPGKNYIAKLPGRSRPAFVRKRRDAIESAFGLTAIARAFGPARPRPSASVERSEPEVRVCSAPSPQYFMTPPQQPPLQIGYTDPSRPTHVAPHALTMYPVQSQYVQTFTEPQPQISETISTKVIAKDSQQEDPAFYQHRCASCGKFRSPSYNIRHQLAAGETPKPSICRKCIKERTSSEGSDSHDESHSQKRNKREAHRNRRERGVERRKNTDSIEEIKRGSSSEEEIRTIRRVRSLSRRPTYLRRSWSRSSTRTRNSYKSNRYRSGRGRLSDEDVVLVKRVRYVERPNRRRSQSRPRNPPPYRRSLNYEDDEKLVEQRSPEYEHPQAHATVEVRRIRQDEFTLHNYDNEHAEDYATEPPLHRSVSMVAHPGTPTRAEQGDYFTRYFTRSTAPYPDHIPIRRQVSRLSYGYDQSHDEALLPPARSVRIVRAQPDSDNPVQIRRWDRDGVGNASSQVSLVEPSYRVQSPEVITVEPDDPLGRQWRGRHQDASGFVEQESINERYPSGSRLSILPCTDQLAD